MDLWAKERGQLREFTAEITPETYFVKVEDQVELADVFKAPIKRLDEDLSCQERSAIEKEPRSER